MKTFSITIGVQGKITVPDSVIRELRITASEDPANGGDKFLFDLNARTQGNDDEFVQAALKNALRNIVRNGILNDIGGMGVGVKAAPAIVTVSVPENIVTKVKAREQVSIERIDVKPRIQSHGEPDSIEQADA
ncbi:hypothetical protein VAC51_00027 [Variovorax phage VAC_51]|uniref:Uncharacterized protein n=1 Tax=Variovorax phage VAC_51 TaxID=2985242 RepID=A0A9N6ZG62_9CAUD|nr:hypothetical protein VAC51_00027 [Variovorax phage VAC_51]